MLVLNSNDSYEKKVDDAMQAFPELNDISAGNIISWLEERPSMSGMLVYEDLMSLKGFLWS